MKSIVFRFCLLIAIGCGLYFLRPVFGTISPSLALVVNKIGGIFSDVKSYIGFSGDVGALRERVEALETENAKLKIGLATKTFPETITAARVIAYSPLDVWQTLSVNVGKSNGVGVGRIALDREGHLVGRVIRALTHTSEILLITNPSDVIDGRIGAQGYRTIVSGQFLKLAAHRGLWLTHGEYIDHHDPIAVGDEVVTSGLDGIYPANIPLGRVLKISRDELNLFQEAVIVPLVDFVLLEDVYFIDR